jgi:alpha/beta superfamily hydrolase
MDNNVILALSSALVKKSIVAFMFNFRGVGGSQGKFGGGVAEKEDVAAAIDWVMSQPEMDNDRLGLAGYSFGAIVSLPTGCALNTIKALALISMPSGTEQTVQLKSCFKPKLIISGTDDMVVPVKVAKLMDKETAEPKQFELIQGADHVWWEYEEALAMKVAGFFKEKL